MIMIPAAHTAATAQIARATGQAETAKTAAAAVSAFKVTLPELPTAYAVSVDAAPVHVTAAATSQLPISSPTGIFVGELHELLR